MRVWFTSLIFWITTCYFINVYDVFMIKYHSFINLFISDREIKGSLIYLRRIYEKIDKRIMCLGKNYKFFWNLDVDFIIFVHLFRVKLIIMSMIEYHKNPKWFSKMKILKWLSYTKESNFGYCLFPIRWSKIADLIIPTFLDLFT